VDPGGARRRRASSAAGRCGSPSPGHRVRPCAGVRDHTLVSRRLWLPVYRGAPRPGLAGSARL